MARRVILRRECKHSRAEVCSNLLGPDCGIHQGAKIAGSQLVELTAWSLWLGLVRRTLQNWGAGRGRRGCSMGGTVAGVFSKPLKTGLQIGHSPELGRPVAFARCRAFQPTSGSPVSFAPIEQLVMARPDGSGKVNALGSEQPVV